MSSEAIIAKLGLDTKDFQKDLNGSVAQVMKAHTQMMRASKGQQSAVDTLGTSIRSAGKAWAMAGIATFTGPLLGAFAIGSIWEAVKAAKELDRELANSIRTGSAEFKSVAALERDLEATSQQLAKVDAALGSTLQTSVNDFTDAVKEAIGETDTLGQKLKAIGKIVVNPGAFIGEVGAGTVLRSTTGSGETNKKNRKAEAALKKEQLKIEEAIANKQAEQIRNQTIALNVSEKAAAVMEAERKHKEALGSAAGKPPEVKQAITSNADAQLRNELQQIAKKHDFMDEDLRLQNEISKLQGSASQRSIAAGQMEIAMLQKRLSTRKDLSAEERDKLTVQINQKSRQVHDAQVERASMTPQELEAERAQERERRRAERLVASRERGRAQSAAANSSDENRDARFAAAKNPESLRPAGLSLKDQIQSDFAKRPLSHEVGKSAESLTGKGQAAKPVDTDQEMKTIMQSVESILKERLGTNR